MSRCTNASFDALVRTTVAASLAMLGAGYVEGAAVEQAICADGATMLNDNGAWSWFEDERAVVDTATGTLLVGSVANRGGTGGAARDGNVEVVSYEIATGQTRRAVLHAGLQGDDHDSAALHVRPDGRYVAMYSQHGSDTLSRWRGSRRPGDVTAWGSRVHHRAHGTGELLQPLPGGRRRGCPAVRVRPHQRAGSAPPGF